VGYLVAVCVGLLTKYVYKLAKYVCIGAKCAETCAIGVWHKAIDVGLKNNTVCLKKICVGIKIKGIYIENMCAD